MKTAEEYYEALLVSFTDRAGYTPSEDCDLAVRLYAAAAELEALSMQADWVLNQSFPQTAQGTYLDSHAELRGLERTAATCAAGMLRFSVESAAQSDLTIAKGTVCMTSGQVRFATTETATLTAGALSVDVPATAVTAGSGGNAAAGTVTILAAYPVGITGCTNPAAFTGGLDAEDDKSLRSRILESYQRLPNGANAAYYEKTAMSHDGVAAASVSARARGIGTVDVYIAAAGGLPSSALLAEVLEDLANKREMAVDVQVLAPTTQAVNVSVEIAVKDGAEFSTVQTAVESAITGYFSGKLLGKQVLLAELGSLVYGVDGVKNYHLLAPTTDTGASASVLPILGTLSVTEIAES